MILLFFLYSACATSMMFQNEITLPEKMYKIAILLIVGGNATKPEHELFGKCYEVYMNLCKEILLEKANV